MSKGKIIGLVIAVVVIIVAVAGFAIYRNQKVNNETSNSEISKNNQNSEQVTNTEEDNETLNNEGDENMDNENSNQETTTQKSKVLIAYFSWAKHTEKMANVIKEQTGADVAEIVRVKDYPTDYNECTEVALEEKNNKERPAIKDLGVNLDDYDTIFVGYPNWWGDMPMPVYTFLEKNNFNGKTVIPFMTSYSSGTSGTFNTIKNIVNGANVLEGIHIYQRDIDNNDYENDMISWLNGLNY